MPGRISPRRLALVLSLTLIPLALCFTVSASGPTLGNYPNQTVQLGADSTVTPDAAPTGAAHFNGEGKQDLATANSGSVSILLGNGAGSFATALLFSDGGSQSVAVGDFNTLLFGIGERIKTINIPIINNSARDGDRTVNITLSNSVGGRLGSIPRAVWSEPSSLQPSTARASDNPDGTTGLRNAYVKHWFFGSFLQRLTELMR